MLYEELKTLTSKTQKGFADDFIGEQVSPGAFDSDMALLKNIGSLHNFKRLMCVLFNEDQTDAGIQNRPDELEQVTHHFRHEPKRRLVKDDQPGIAHQPASNGDHLLLPAAHRTGQLGLAFC